MKKKKRSRNVQKMNMMKKHIRRKMTINDEDAIGDVAFGP